MKAAFRSDEIGDIYNDGRIVSWARHLALSVLKQGWIFVACLSLGYVSPIPAFAVERPDAGRLLEEMKPPLALPREQKPAIEIREEKAPSAAAATDGIKVAIHDIHFTGNTVFGEKELLAVVSNYLGQELTFTDMTRAAAKVTNYYRKAGYLVAHAYLPAQEVKNGLVEIAIIEGRLGKLEVIRDKDARMSEATLKRYLSGAVREGDIVREDRMNRGTLLINDVPGIEVQSTLKPGATVGTSDLVLAMKEKFPISMSIDGDNYGNRNTGNYRGGFAATENNLAGIGEAFTFRGMASDGMLYGYASLNMPASNQGTRLGISLSDMEYKLGDQFSSLNAKGNALVGSIFLLHPFVRQGVSNLYGHFQYDYKTMVDRIDSTSTKTLKDINSGTFALYMDSQDGFWGGGANGVTLTGVVGYLDIRSPEARSNDASTAGTNGVYAKGSLNASRLQSLIGDLSFYAAFTGQIASGNLDSSEKLSLGGSAGVRSYLQSEVTGDNGYIVTGELRYLLPKFVPGDVQLSGFSDMAKVWINQKPWDGAGSANSGELYGVGVGLNWRINHFKLNTSYAWKLGHDALTSNPDRSGLFLIQATAWF